MVCRAFLTNIYYDNGNYDKSIHSFQWLHPRFGCKNGIALSLLDLGHVGEMKKTSTLFSNKYKVRQTRENGGCAQQCTSCAGLNRFPSICESDGMEGNNNTTASAYHNEEEYETASACSMLKGRAKNQKQLNIASRRIQDHRHRRTMLLIRQLLPLTYP